MGQCWCKLGRHRTQRGASDARRPVAWRSPDDAIGWIEGGKGDACAIVGPYRIDIQHHPRLLRGGHLPALTALHIDHTDSALQRLRLQVRVTISYVYASDEGKFVAIRRPDRSETVSTVGIGEAT